MLCVVAPVLHRLPVAELEVNVTEPPEQNVVEPLTVMVGMLGVEPTETVVTLLIVEVQMPLIARTV